MIVLLKEDLGMNMNVLRNLSYGVYVISALDGDRPTGCVANSVMQITSSPVTVALSMNHDNFTNSCIRKCGKFAVSILAVDSDPSLIGTFGFQSGKEIDKFAEIPYETKEGLPVIPDSCGYMVFKVIGETETSTHTIFLGELLDGDVFGTAEAMTYAYYHKVVKGKSPKNAPTYIPEDQEQAAASKTVWKCKVCGYEYDGEIPFEELPDDYKCPICQQPKAVFQQVSK